MEESQRRRRLPRLCLLAWFAAALAATALDAEASPSPMHCAFCLSSISHRSPIRCDLCSRRIYCSEECQAEDNKEKDGVGQNHKNWCSLEYGEEGIDWEVRKISPEKGMGVVALRKFRDGERVMIERGLTHEQVVAGLHPAMKDLEPKDGSLDDKFSLNAVGVPDGGEDRLGVRVSRCNHGCNYNVQYWWTPSEEDVCTMVLVAAREIQKGEEIVTAYVSFDNCWHDISADECRQELSSEWGIMCPPDCICYDKERNRMIAQYRKLFKVFQRHASSSSAKAAKEISPAFDKMMELMQLLKFGVCARAHMYLGAAMAAAQHEETRPRVLVYLQLYQEGEMTKFGRTDASIELWWRQAQGLEE